jgi:hypothetical protein
MSGTFRARPAAGSELAAQVWVHLAGDVAFQAAHDLAFGAAFFEAPFEVGLGWAGG